MSSGNGNHFVGLNVLNQIYIHCDFDTHLACYVQLCICAVCKYVHGSWIRSAYYMTTSSNGNILRVTDPLCGKFTGHRWIPLTKASDAELWYFFLFAPEQTLQ